MRLGGGAWLCGGRGLVVTFGFSGGTITLCQRDPESLDAIYSTGRCHDYVVGETRNI